MASTKTALRLALVATTLSAGMLTSAFAQSTAPTTPPVVQAPTPPMQTETFYSGTIQATGFRASEAMDVSVTNLQKEKIGEIKDLLIDSEGRVVAAIIGVGGFLGMGERDVAVTYRAVKLSRDKDGKALLVLDVTKEALKLAPAFTTVRSAKSN